MIAPLAIARKGVAWIFSQEYVQSPQKGKAVEFQELEAQARGGQKRCPGGKPGCSDSALDTLRQFRELLEDAGRLIAEGTPEEIESWFDAGRRLNSELAAGKEDTE